jgi:hypothetical protein
VYGKARVRLVERVTEEMEKRLALCNKGRTSLCRRLQRDDGSERKRKRIRKGGGP